MTSEDSDNECELGKLQHWERAYVKELQNFQDHGDEGEIWFGEDVLEVMLAWTDQLLMQLHSRAKCLQILDLGTGNGVFLTRLAALGYSNLTGCDYSAASIKLATAVALKQGVANIRWIHDDLLDSGIQDRFYVLTDKGTFDAVGLMANAAETKANYKSAVWRLLEDNGLFIVTSCNSTAEELQEEFAQEKAETAFKYVDMVKTYPVFQFGGKTGSKVCTLAFEKVSH